MSVKAPGPPRTAGSRAQAPQPHAETARRAGGGADPPPPEAEQAHVVDHFQTRREVPARDLIEAPPPPGVTGTGTSVPSEPRTTPATIPFSGITLVTHGAVRSAILEAARVTQLVAQRSDVAEALRRADVKLVIIPSDQKLTDLPEFAHLAGRRTFDGRPWDEVRGVGGTYGPDGELYVGVPEENLARLPSDTFSGDFSVALHELAHVVHDHAVSSDEQRIISAAYARRSEEGGPWTDSYAAINEREYFAQGANAYFGCHALPDRDAGWLYENDPTLFALLSRIFPQRSLALGEGGAAGGPATAGTPSAAGGLLELLRGNRDGDRR